MRRTQRICPECRLTISMNHHFEFPCAKCGNVYYESYNGQLKLLKFKDLSYHTREKIVYQR